MSLSDSLRLKDVGAAHAAILGRAPNFQQYLTRLAGVAPYMALDFAGGQYFKDGGQSELASVPGYSFTRASAGYAQNAAGLLLPFASGVPRITDKGVLVEGARTNKCTNYNAALPALVTPAVLATFNAAVTNLVAAGGDGNTLFGIVDDAAALAVAGLSGAVTNGRVIKIDNSAGAATAFINLGGTTGNTNAHTMSAYLRANAPVTSAPMTFTGGSGNNFDITTAYQRYTQTFTPGAGTNQSTLRCPAGSVMYFILNQLEEGAFVSSPIVVAGASATRVADVLTFSSISGAYPWSLYAEFERVVDTGGAGVSLLIGASDSERGCLIVSSADTADMIVTTGGAQQNSSTSVAGALALNTPYRSAMRAADNDMRCARGGTLGNLDATGTMPASPGRITLGTAYSGASPMFGYIRRTAIFNAALADARLQALTA